MKKALKNAFLTLLVIGILLVILQGRAVPVDKSIYKKIGRFSLRPYKYGLYLTQLPSGIFYNFSPHNDYYIDNGGNEIRLLTPESKITNRESVYIYRNNKLKAKLLAILSYLDLVQLKTSFETSTGLITYNSYTSGNTLSVGLTGIPNKDSVQSVIMTLSINPTDNVIETPEYILVENPKTLGVVKIKVNKNKGALPYQNITVDKEANLIKFEVPKEDPRIELTLFDSLEESL